MEQLCSIFMLSKLSCYQHKIVYYSCNMFYMSLMLTKTQYPDVDAQNFKWGSESTMLEHTPLVQRKTAKQATE